MSSFNIIRGCPRQPHHAPSRRRPTPPAASAAARCASSRMLRRTAAAARPLQKPHSSRQCSSSGVASASMLGAAAQAPQASAQSGSSGVGTTWADAGEGSCHQPVTLLAGWAAEGRGVLLPAAVHGASAAGCTPGSGALLLYLLSLYSLPSGSS